MKVTRLILKYLLDLLIIDKLKFIHLKLYLVIRFIHTYKYYSMLSSPILELVNNFLNLESNFLIFFS